MPSRFKLPTVSRRQISTALVILVLVLAVVYLTQFRITPGSPPTEAMQAFRSTCTKAARHANGGGDLVMDDATEEKIGAYCGCVADAVESNAAPGEIAKIAQGKVSDTTMQLLSHIVEGCKPKLE